MYQNVILEHLCINKLLKHKSLFMIKSTMKTKTFYRLKPQCSKGLRTINKTLNPSKNCMKLNNVHELIARFYK